VNVTVTLGSLCIGLILLMREFLPVVWPLVTKKGGGAAVKLTKGEAAPATGKSFDVRAHIPFLLGLTIGMLAISCPGGIIGQIAAKVLGVSNAIGDKALTSGTGSAVTAVTRHAATQLAAGGAVVTVLLVVAVIILRKSMPKPARKQLIAGLWCGITLGLSSGAAGITGSVLIPAANQFGAALGGTL
jgi:hypothetical protein